MIEKSHQSRREQFDGPADADTQAEERSCAVAILAGGLSSRMGCDKAMLHWRDERLLDRIHRTSRCLGWPVHVITRDIVPRCGPLGGIVTAFASIDAESIVFLACDMPLISEALLRLVAAPLSGAHTGRFTEADGRVGFPFLLRAQAEVITQRQINDGAYSINRLADVVGADRIILAPSWRHEVFNANTPEDWQTALEMMQQAGA